MSPVFDAGGDPHLILLVILGGASGGLLSWRLANMLQSPLLVKSLYGLQIFIGMAVALLGYALVRVYNAEIVLLVVSIAVLVFLTYDGLKYIHDYGYAWGRIGISRRNLYRHMIIAVFIYLLIRGILFPSGTIGTLIFAFIIGLLSDLILAKLKRIAEVTLRAAPSGKDHF